MAVSPSVVAIKDRCGRGRGFGRRFHGGFWEFVGFGVSCTGRSYEGG